MSAELFIPAPGDALIVVDLQNDFLPGGTLAVRHGDEVIAPLNRYLKTFADAALPIYATRDWHPPNHCSFKAFGGPWPPHCIVGTPGAAFAVQLELPPTTQIISKAMAPQKDAYSGFSGTDLRKRLVSGGVRRVFIGGLATDYCVLNTVLDARKAGFEVIVIENAVRAVELNPGDGARALEQMRHSGAQLLPLGA